MRKSRNHVTTLTQSAKQQYLATLAHNLSNDSCKFWQKFNVKHLSTWKKAHGSTLDIDVESVNQHFLTIVHKTVGELQLSTTSPLSYISVSGVPVHECICDLSIQKAVGVDRISIEFITTKSWWMGCFCLSLNDSVLKQFSSTKYEPRTIYRSSFNLEKACRLHFKEWGENLLH